MATGVDAKLLKSTKFPPEFNQKVDMQKVNIQVMKKWIASKVTEILANEDDVVIELVFNLLESGRYPDIKSMQIQLTGFLDKDTPTFCRDLWKLLLSAQTSPQGVPKELLEAKKMELIQEKKRHDRNVENSKVDLKGAAAAEEAAEVAVGDLAHHRVSVIKGTVAHQEEDSEIHMFPEEVRHSDVAEDDGTTGDGDLELGRRLCGRGPALVRGHPALTEAGDLLLDPLALLQDGDGASGHHRHGADPDTGGAPDLGLARFHPIVALAPPSAAVTPLPLVGAVATPGAAAQSQSNPEPESEPKPVEGSKQALQSVRIVYWIFSSFPIAKPHPG
ncbi:PWI domain-containing protein [Neurospora crassa]|nr:PWI domain-containing protein [Neurospora crassa]